MQSKTLLLALTVAAFSSCSTVYKSGQTPDDVYYSPVKVVLEKEKENDEVKEERYESANDYEITMGIRDRRWRDFREDYEYRKSPYYYATCNKYNYGYYYNPYYYPWAIYTATPRVNTTPRMVNLNAYNGYNTRVAEGKTSGRVTWANPSSQYNNSNRSGSRLGNILRQTIEPTPSTTSSNNTRTYTPSSNSSSGSSSSGSSSGSSSTSRPKRGG